MAETVTTVGYTSSCPLIMAALLMAVAAFINECVLLCVCTVPRTKAFLSVTNLPRNYSDASNK